MTAAVPVALLVLAQAAQGATDDSAQPHAPRSAPAADCAAPTADSNTIVICTQRPNGYRLNPDVMEAKREMRSKSRPVRPNGIPPPDCATVGPAPCVNAGINLLSAAATAVEMAQRLSKGEEIGSMFVTDPHPDEYHLYLMAKARREQEEAEKAAVAKAKAAAAGQTPARASDK